MVWSQFLDLLKSHRNYWLLCAGLLAANLLFYIIFVAGEMEQIGQLQKNYQAQRQALAQRHKSQLQVARFNESQKAWQTFLDSVDTKITFPDRLGNLETLFRRHNLDPGGLTFKSEKVSGLPLVRFVSAIQTTGDYADLKALINGIRDLPGLFCIESISIDKNRQAGTLVLKMDLAAYFRDMAQPGGPQKNTTGARQNNGTASPKGFAG